MNAAIDELNITDPLTLAQAAWSEERDLAVMLKLAKFSVQRSSVYQDQKECIDYTVQGMNVADRKRKIASCDGKYDATFRVRTNTGVCELEKIKATVYVFSWWQSWETETPIRLVIFDIEMMLRKEDFSNWLYKPNHDGVTGFVFKPVSALSDYVLHDEVNVVPYVPPPKRSCGIHIDFSQWVTVDAGDGRTKTTCRDCGLFIGYGRAK